MAKAWLRERWETLLPALEALSLDQEEEIARVCEEEIAAWKARPSMKSLSSLKEPMTDTRNEIRKLALTDENSYFNERLGKREHIALKYLNYSESEWAEMDRSSRQRHHERLRNQQMLEHPDKIVEKARELLSSLSWVDVVVGLAVVTGRRLSEILKAGEIYPKTRYTVVFSGQLKRKDVVLKPYEIPVLIEADLVLAAWRRVREQVDCSQMETEAIGKAYSTEVGDAAERHFSHLVPLRTGRVKLFNHLFRTVYPRLAVYYFCPIYVNDIAYGNAILGHYWESEDGEIEPNYESTLHYTDYKISDGNGNIDGRQGIRLGEPGVVVLEMFPEPVEQKKEPKKVLSTEKKKDHSATRLSQETKSRLDQVQGDLGVRTQDEAMSAAIDAYYVLRQVGDLLKPLYEQLNADNPFGAVQALLSDGGAIQVDQRLKEQFQTDLAGVVGLLDDAAQESEQPVVYLKKMLADKRVFKKSYEKRHVGKNYSSMTTSELRRTKTAEAAQERFKRAVDAIIAYNDQASMPELRWYISPAVVVDLVGGKPSLAGEYIETRKDEIDAHHEKYKLTPGYNRRPIPITERVTVAELPSEGTEE